MDEAVLFETAEDGLDARAMPARGSGVLAVVFSQVRVPAGRFGLSRLFARTAHARLHLNQPDNGWYRGTDRAVDRALARAVAAVRPRRIVLYGSSMGAYGALSAAARHPSAEAVVFSPDFRVGEPGSRSAEAGLAPAAGEDDLAALLARPRTGRVDVAIGLFDPYDAGVAARLRLAALPAPVRLTTLASGHEVHDHLFSLNVIRRVIAGFTREVAAEAGSKGLALAMDDPEPYARFAALALGLAEGRPDPAAVAALPLAGNPGVGLLEAASLAAAGDDGAAAARLAGLDAAIAASPTLLSLPKRWRKEIPRRRIALLAALGRPAEAAAVARAAATAFPEDAGFAGAVDDGLRSA